MGRLQWEEISNDNIILKMSQPNFIGHDDAYLSPDR